MIISIDRVVRDLVTHHEMYRDALQEERANFRDVQEFLIEVFSEEQLEALCSVHALGGVEASQKLLVALLEQREVRAKVERAETVPGIFLGKESM